MPDNVPKVVHIVKVKNLRPAVNTESTTDNISSGDPKIADTIETLLANLQTVNDSINRKNSLIMHLHGSKFEVARDLLEAHSSIQHKSAMRTDTKSPESIGEMGQP